MESRARQGGGPPWERLFSAFSGENLRVRQRSVWVGPAQVKLFLQFFFIFIILKEIQKQY
jgi:hypothetical protein